MTTGNENAVWRCRTASAAMVIIAGEMRCDVRMRKAPGDYPGASHTKGGIDLLSRICSTIGRCVLTSVLGMGPGVAHSV